jgi:hypothetical protein
VNRAEFLDGIVQRDRNVIQKIERVAAVRSDPSARLFGFVKYDYDNAQRDLDAPLTERNDFIADYIDGKPPKNAVTVSVRIVGLDELRTLVDRLTQAQSKSAAADAAGTLGDPNA